MTDINLDVVLQTKQIGEARQIDPLTISKMDSPLLADIAVQALNKPDLKKLVITVGDNSGTISGKLGTPGNFILEKIATGVPSGLAFGKNMLIVLKSGSFGGPDFLIEAAEHHKDLTLHKKLTENNLIGVKSLFLDDPSSCENKF